MVAVSHLDTARMAEHLLLCCKRMFLAGCIYQDVPDVGRWWFDGDGGLLYSEESDQHLHRQAMSR